MGCMTQCFCVAMEGIVCKRAAVQQNLFSIPHKNPIVWFDDNIFEQTVLLNVGSRARKDDKQYYLSDASKQKCLIEVKGTLP